MEQNVTEGFSFGGVSFGQSTYCTTKRVDTDAIFPPTGQTRYLESALRYTPILNRCFPLFKLTNVSSVSNLIKEQLNDAGEITSRLWGDLMRAYGVLIACGIFALAFGFLILFFMRIFTGVVVWAVIFLVFIAIMALGGLTFYEGYTQRIELQKQDLDTTVANILFYTGIVIMGLGAIYALAVVFLFLRIRKAIGIIQEASKALGAIPQLIFFPVLIFGIMALFIFWWIVVVIFLWSSGEATIKSFAVSFKLDLVSRILFGVHIFGFFWITQFLIAFLVTVVAGAVGSWYWRRDKKLLLPWAVTQSFKRTALYHIGTVAFGALLVAVVQYIRLLFEKAQRELEKASQENKIVKGLGWLVRIILWIFEKIVKFVNKHAYIQVNKFFIEKTNL